MLRLHPHVTNMLHWYYLCQSAKRTCSQIVCGYQSCFTQAS